MRGLAWIACGWMLVASAADGQGFGRNKVQYAEFAWRKMETEHFDVYFFAEEEELAAYAAQMAERQFADLEKKFAHTVQRRVPLVVYSSHIYFEQTNIIPNILPEGVAGFTEYLKGRVALPLSGSLPEFERVLHHELIHVFTFDRIARVLKQHGILDFRPAPLWFSEGLAEYWSSEPNSFGEMIVRDALFARRLVSIAEMYRIYGTYQLYKEGESICHFMAARHGADVFEQLFANWWRGETFGEIFAITTGESLDKFDQAWQYHLHKRHLPAIADRDPPSELATARTQRGFNIKPEIVPGDSSAFYHFRNDQGYTQIVRARRDGSDPEVVVEGERLPVFESLHPLSTRLAASPDGKWLAFAAKSRGRDHLYIWDVEQKRAVGDLSFAEIVAIASPSFAPDGQRLTFAGSDEGGWTDIYLVDVTGDSLRALRRDIYHDREPDWSPDGRHIVFSSDRWSGGRRGRYNLFLYDLATEQILALSRGEHNDGQPRWSPDGERIVFSSDRAGAYNIYALQLAAERTETRRLTHVLTGAFDPVLLADGQHLLFSGYESGGFQIYELAVDWADSAEVSYQRVEEAAAEPWSLASLHGQSEVASRPYERKMSLDIAQGQISQDPEFGTSGGIQVALSDVLGNDQYHFVLSHIAASRSGFFDGLNVALTRLHLGQRLNAYWGVFRLNDRFSSRFGRFVREERLGAHVGLSYPFSQHDRIDTRLSLRHAEIDRQFEGRKLSGWLANNYVSYTHDSSLWIPTGPLEGQRYSFGLAQTIDFKTSRRFNIALFGDYRYYFRLSQRSALAVRLMGRRSTGAVPEFFSLGGSWTLRGYRWRSLWGSKMVLYNQELRFPLVDRFLLHFPFGAIEFSAFRGALFFDVGNAWNDDFDQWRAAFGTGVRLALGGVFVFRLDAARRTDFKSIDGDTRWDFFFGWDY